MGSLAYEVTIIPLSLVDNIANIAVNPVLCAITMITVIFHGTNVVPNITFNASTVEYGAIVAPVAFPNTTIFLMESAIS